MTHELKRPLFFNVQPSKRPAALGVVSPLELAKLDRKLRVDGTGGGWLDGEEHSPRPPPASVTLPLVRSPRPEKPVYVASPSKTPQYFRWKRPLPPGHKDTPGKSAASKSRPTAPSPRTSLGRDNSSGEAAPHRMRSTQNLRLSGSDEPFDLVTSQLDEQEAVNQTETLELSPWQQPSLFHYSDPLAASFSAPTSPPSNMLFSEPPSASWTPAKAATTRRSSLLGLPSTPTSSPMTRSDPLSPQPVVALSAPASARSALESQPPSLLEQHHQYHQHQQQQQQQQQQQHQAVSASSSFSDVLHSRSASTPLEVQGNTSVEAQDRSSMTGTIIATVATESALDERESPFAHKMMLQSRPAQEKVISQHVLRGAFLRKYLHVTTIMRTLRETEDRLRSSALTASPAGSRVGSRRGTLSSRASTHSCSDTEELTEFSFIDQSAPALRRLSSIDKAINKTVKRIRRLSGLENSSEQEQQSSASVTVGAIHAKRKSLHVIAENSPNKLSAKHESTSANGDSDDTLDTGDPNNCYFGDIQIDPSSAHMLRICQHAMAKRAMKAFVHQEASTIHQIEAALRDDDDDVMQRHRAATPAGPDSRRGSVSSQFASGGGSESSSALGSSRDGCQPIKCMSTDVVEAVSGYLQDGDECLTVRELFFAGLDAEKRKLWKRAILLASACVVVDRELYQAVLLRARCCRRLGLWTQAVKDLGHALMLRPEDARVLLLRAFLLAKVGDLDSALADTNRALLLQPKATDALLLRAAVFHRQCNIGASLQDLTAVLSLDPGCWRAHYDRATLRLRAVEGDEQCLSYHWEHVAYDTLLASIIDDYVAALRKGCKMVEIVETVGDLAVRLLEFSGDASALRQVVQNLAQLLRVLSRDVGGAFAYTRTSGLEKPHASGDTAPLTALERELLVAAIHAQRGRLLVLLGDRASARAEFDHAVVSEYHYPVAHFYRGAFAATASTPSTQPHSPRKDGAAATAADDAYKANVAHLSRSIALDPTIAGAYTVRGALHLRELKFASALQDLKAAVATDPTLFEVWLQIALVHLNHYHDPAACIHACSSALTNDSCLARALYLRAEAYTRQGNFGAALRDYGRLTLAEPSDRWASLVRGRLLLQLGLARPALYSFISFLELGSAGGDTLCGLACQILARFQDAVARFQRAVRTDPSPENFVLLSEALHSLGDTESSLRASERAIHADPGSCRGYVRRAQLLASVGQLQRALAEYDKALFLAPKDARVCYERGLVHMQLYLRWRAALRLSATSVNFNSTVSNFNLAPQPHDRKSPFEPQLSVVDIELALGGDATKDEPAARKMMQTCFARSVADLSKSIRLEPLQADAYVLRAELFALSEDYERAFRDFAAALERNPKCVRAHVNLGVLKCHFSAFASAISDFDQAIKHDAKLALAYLNRGVAYHRLSLWSHADKSFSTCIELSGRGRSVDAHRNRAIVRCQLGEFAGALRDLEEVRQSAPDDDQLHGALGYVLLQLGRYEDAAKAFAAYGRLSRNTFADSGNAYLNLATRSTARLSRAAYLGYLRTARRFYVRAARIHPSNSGVRLNIANCLRKQGEFARAVRQCDAITAVEPLHHAALESKALALLQMQRPEDAIACMDAAVRACVASSATLENTFFAFTRETLHRNAFERKTVVSRDASSRGTGGARPAAAATSSATHTSAAAAAVTPTPPPTETLNLRVAPPTPTSASEIIVSGAARQLLSLYMLNRGVMYEQANDLERARQNFQDAIHLDAHSANAHIFLGTLDLLEARYPEAIASFAQALAVDPNAAIAHINAGVVYLCVDDLEQALSHLDAALTLEPSCSYAYANKAVALARRGDATQAEHNLRRAIEELPSRKEFYLARGKLIAQQKRLQDAMVDFSTALFLGYEGKL